MPDLTIVEFLRARLYAEEVVARQATPGPWTTFGLQDPQHTIAGIQAARKVLDMYEEAEVAVRPSDEGEEDYFDGVRLGLYVAVVALAGRYSSHSDFNADWDMGTQVGGKLDGYLR